jgi:hypothetical protein
MKENRICPECGKQFRCDINLRSMICSATLCRINRRKTVKTRKASYDKDRRITNNISRYITIKL